MAGLSVVRGGNAKTKNNTVLSRYFVHKSIKISKSDKTVVMKDICKAVV